MSSRDIYQLMVKAKEVLPYSLGKCVVSVSGKGGVGKTTFTALLLKALIEEGMDSILVVDADPDTNLPDVLGIEVKRTVGEVVTRMKKDIDEGKIPPGTDKELMLEAMISETLIEGSSFDMLVMGRPEGEGCYCFVNLLLTRILDRLTSNYRITLMDMEAGLEHVSRRTDRDVDIMVVVTDASKMGLLTAQRIRRLAREVHVEIRQLYVVGNQIPPELEGVVRKRAQDLALKYVGSIPFDKEIMEYNLVGRSLLELPSQNPAYAAVREFAQTIRLV